MRTTFWTKPKTVIEERWFKFSCNTWLIACWSIRSMTVGIPSFLFPPSCFEISTRRTSCRLYFPWRNWVNNSSLCSFKYGSSWSYVIPSTPAAPLFLTTWKLDLSCSLIGFFQTDWIYYFDCSVHHERYYELRHTLHVPHYLSADSQILLFSAVVAPSTTPRVFKISIVIMLRFFSYIIVLSPCINFLSYCCNHWSSLNGNLLHPCIIRAWLTK